MRKNTEGYVVIIVLLLVSVLLMLGLSLASRTTEEVYLSGQEADTTRVFNQAESGIEQGLSGIQSGDLNVTADGMATDLLTLTNTETNTKYVVTGKTAAKFDLPVDQGDALTLKWKTGTSIAWQHAVNCSDAAAVIVSVYYTSGTAKEAHLAYNPYGTDPTCAKGDGFTAVTDNGSSMLPSPATGSKFSLTAASFIPGILAEQNILNADVNALLRIRPLYNDAHFYLTGSSVIELTSSATDNTNTGATSQANRKIQAIRTEPAPPAIFDYAVFSGGALQK